MSLIHSWFVAAGAALVLAAPMSAQQAASAKAGVAPDPSAPQLTTPAPAASIVPTATSVARSLGVPLFPATASLGVSFTPLMATPEVMMPLPAEGGQSTNVAMMIVGGAMMVVGSVVDGDTGTIIMVSGGAIGLIGLYRYLR